MTPLQHLVIADVLLLVMVLDGCRCWGASTCRLTRSGLGLWSFCSRIKGSLSNRISVLVFCSQEAPTDQTTAQFSTHHPSLAPHWETVLNCLRSELEACPRHHVSWSPETKDFLSSFLSICVPVSSEDNARSACVRLCMCCCGFSLAADTPAWRLSDPASNPSAHQVSHCCARVANAGRL